MTLVHQASAATVMVLLTLFIQCAGMGALIHWGRTRFARGIHRLGPFRSALLMVRFTSVFVALHMVQILLWAGFYRRVCFPAWEAALYFSTTSFSTVGAGDLLLPQGWRTLGAIESVTGVLMCGLSAAFLFAIVTRLIEIEGRFTPELARLTGERVPPNAGEIGSFVPSMHRDRERHNPT